MRGILNSLVSMGIIFCLLLFAGCKEAPKESPPPEPAPEEKIDCREVTRKIIELWNMPGFRRLKQESEYRCMEKMSEAEKACILKATTAKMLRKCETL